MGFATQLVELTLANLLYRFDWELPHGMKREDLDMEEAAGITVQKKVPLCLTATPVLYLGANTKTFISSISDAENKKAPSLLGLFQDVQKLFMNFWCISMTRF